MHDSNVLGTVPVLKPTLFLPLSSVFVEIKFVGKPLSRSECRIGTPLTAATLTPGLLKHGKKVDIIHFHVSPAHAHASVLKATTKQHGIHLTGERGSCSASSRAKGNQVPTPYHATRRATQRLGLVHIDTAGPYPTSLEGSRHVVMFVDSASRLQRPHGAREKSAAVILSVVKRFVADMRVPRAFRTDNGKEYSNSMFVDFCNGLGIHREFTAPFTLQQNGSVSRARYRELLRLDTRRVLGLRSYTWTSVWKRSGISPTLQERASGRRAATPVNDEGLSRHDIFYGSRPRLLLLPFLQPV